MKSIIYSPHLNFRLKLRSIPQALPKTIYNSSKERYFDTATKKFIAIKKVQYKGKMREMIVVYEENQNLVNLITVHPLQGMQKSNRIKSGRWIKI